jgi:tetratricopeptide (TPR) repeat protein
MKKDAPNVSYQVNPSPLEEHAGQVAVTISGQFPEKYFNKKAVVTATPVLVYEGGETAFEPVTLQGESVQENNKVISYSGGNFSYNGKVDFTDAMRRSQLMLRATATLKSKTLDFDPIKLADGVVATPTLVKTMPHPVIMPDKYQRIIPEAKEADIKFVINRYNLRNSQLKKEDVTTLLNFVKDVAQASNLEFTGSEIHGYASPDGPLDFNDKLSKKRAGVVDKYMAKKFKKAKVVEDVSKIQEHSTAEDWDGFKQLVQASDLKDKDLILRVLSMYSDPEVREKEIKNMAAAYEELKTDILPQLRRSVIRVNVNKIGFSDEEILKYIESNPDTLGIEAMLHAAALTDDAATQLKYYQTAFEKYPKCIRAINNIGAVYLKMGKVDEAENALKQAEQMKAIDPVKINMGYVELMKGNKDKAEEYFTSVQTPANESNFGLGTIAIMNGKYQDAVNYFGSQKGFNPALAQLLNGDAQAAKNILDAMDHTCKWKEYLYAVVGARLGDENMVMDHLKKSVAEDAKMKDLAKTDMEFAKYFENEQFKSIVQ